MDSIGHLVTLLLLCTCIVSAHGLEGDDQEAGGDTGAVAQGDEALDIDESSGRPIFSSGEPPVDAEALKEFEGNITVVRNESKSAMARIEAINEWVEEAAKAEAKNKTTEFDFLLHGINLTEAKMELKNLAEGDMILDSADKEMIKDWRKHANQSIVTGSKRGALTSAARKLWRTRVVPYVWDHNGTDQESATQVYDAVMKAMRDIESKSCVTFRPKQPKDQYYMRIYKGAGCASNVGRKLDDPAINDLRLGDGCIEDGAIKHELFHTLGMFHEQSRTDRDSFVTIVWENIKAGYNMAQYGDVVVASQSVPATGTSAPAALAVDQNIETYSSVKGVDPFWLLDFGKDGQFITRFHIYNRQDCCMEELKGFSIDVSETVGQADMTCAEDIDMSELKDKWVQCKTEYMWGQYVRIYMKGDRTLALGEVEVYVYAYDKVTQFERHPAYDLTFQEEPYDYESIMHYSAQEFTTKSGERTVVRKFDSTAAVGGAELTDTDIRELNKMYQCKLITDTDSATWSFWNSWSGCFSQYQSQWDERQQSEHKEACMRMRQRTCLQEDVKKCKGKVDTFGVEDQYQTCDEKDCSKSEVFEPRWGGWSLSSACSASCDDGLMVSIRECNNPPPKDASYTCKGDRTKTQICRIKKCTPNDVDTDFEDGVGTWTAEKPSNAQKWNVASGTAYKRKFEGPQGDHTLKVKGPTADAITGCFTQSSGWCVGGNGKDVASRRLGSYTADVRSTTDCIRMCQADPDTSACGAVAKGSLAGCYGFLEDVSKQSKDRPDRICWTTPKICKEKLLCNQEFKGMCQSESGANIGNKVKLSSEVIDTPDKKAACLKLCQAYDGATGCATVGAEGGAEGCYAYTGSDDASRPGIGDKAEKATCWVFEKCKGSYVTLYPVSAASLMWGKDQPAQLVSRKMTTAKGPKCLHFYFQTNQVPKAGSFEYLYVLLDYGDTKKKVWEKKLSAARWEKGAITLPMSDDEFQVKIVGRGFFASLDDIQLDDGECMLTADDGVACRDHHDYCPIWKEHGYCYKESKYMLGTCCESCRGMMDCSNRYGDVKCNDWAKKDYCTLYPKLMWDKCCVSCHGCLDKYKRCSTWVDQNKDCKVPFLKENCKSSCGICKA